jgi:hypothetical protein
LGVAANTGVLKKPKEEHEEGHVNEDLLGIFEKEFDVADMTEKTLESMFNKLGLRPDKPLPPAQAAAGGAAGKGRQTSPEKAGTTLRAQPVISD